MIVTAINQYSIPIIVQVFRDETIFQICMLLVNSRLPSIFNYKVCTFCQQFILVKYYLSKKDPTVGKLYDWMPWLHLSLHPE